MIMFQCCHISAKKVIALIFMLTWIIIVAVSFITFCATPLGRDLLQKLNNYNYKKETEKIEQDWRAEMKRLDEEAGSDVLGYLDRKEAQDKAEKQSQIEKLKTDLQVNIAYGQYLESLKGKRRVQKVLTIEEFIEANFEQFKPMVCTVNLNDAGEIESVNIGDEKNIPIETVRRLSPEIYNEIMKEYRRQNLS